MADLTAFPPVSLQPDEERLRADVRRFLHERLSTGFRPGPGMGGGWTWIRIEVSRALVRAAQVGRCDPGELLAVLDADLGLDGRVTQVSAPQGDVEAKALNLVRAHALRAMDAWHLAAATLIVPTLAEPHETHCFATRDKAQAAVAQTLGFETL